MVRSLLRLEPRKMRRTSSMADLSRAEAATDSPPVSDPFQRASAAQRVWRELSVARRLEPIAGLRAALASDPCAVAETCGRANLAETLAAEVLPLADACCFLQKTAKRTLAPQHLSRRGRPLWLRSVRVKQVREPHGLVLVVGPSNYPLMLPGIQALQALVAGNAVLLKPAPNCTPAAAALRELLIQSGLDGDLLQILPEDAGVVADAVRCGIDKLILTGSASTGEAVGRLLADETVPATMELSGCDAMFVTVSADIDRAVRCLHFGLNLNDGRTCIAPRRIFVDQRVEPQLLARLSGFPAVTNLIGSSPTTRFAAQLVDEAVSDGATVLLDGIDRTSEELYVRSQTVLTGGHPAMRIANEDVFAPVTTVFTYSSVEDAIATSNESSYALGGTVFGTDSREVDLLVRRINAGCIVVNDMIAPTADPRVAFGGRKKSGFGVTRVRAGLEEMTRLKVVINRTGSWLPHLDEPTPLDAGVLAGLIKSSHSPGLLARLRGSIGLLRSVLAQRKYRKQSKGTG